MFEKLKEKWKVTGFQVILILCTFALGGSLCGYGGKKILAATEMEKNVVWYIIYLLLVTLLWPFCVLLISIPFGQYPFFRNYIARIFTRMGMRRRSTNVK